jgi:hypothetical protein
MAMATFSLPFAYEGEWTLCSGELSPDYKTIPPKPSFNQALQKENFFKIAFE